MTAHTTVQKNLLWGYDPNFIISKHLEVLFLQSYVRAKIFTHAVIYDIYSCLIRLCMAMMTDMTISKTTAQVGSK